MKMENQNRVVLLELGDVSKILYQGFFYYYTGFTVFDGFSFT